MRYVSFDSFLGYACLAFAEFRLDLAGLNLLAQAFAPRPQGSEWQALRPPFFPTWSQKASQSPRTYRQVVPFQIS